MKKGKRLSNSLPSLKCENSAVYSGFNKLGKSCPWMIRDPKKPNRNWIKYQPCAFVIPRQSHSTSKKLLKLCPWKNMTFPEFIRLKWCCKNLSLGWSHLSKIRMKIIGNGAKFIKNQFLKKTNYFYIKVLELQGLSVFYHKFFFYILG